MIWWRLGRKNSELMRKLKSQAHQQAHQHNLERPHFYNWSRHTDRFIHRIAQRTAKSPAQFRKMSKDTFRHVISTTPWTEEYDKRLEICNSPRLQLIATELAQLAKEDRRAKIQRKRWPGAPYLSFVDSRFHWRLLAMTRLGVLPIEIETGPWHGVPREQRGCSLGCDHIGDTAHFLHRCEHIAYYNRTYKLT